MKIYIACDHRGLELKKSLIEELSINHQVCDSIIKNDEEDDYPDFAFDICNRMDKNNDIGILICGNGIGISIAANKVKGIRCGRVLTKDDAIKSREHNFANVIALPADMNITTALDIINAFIATAPSSIERHIRRVNKINSYELGAKNVL